MTFDFPKIIYTSSGIAYDDNNIYFIGGNTSTDENKLYKLIAY